LRSADIADENAEGRLQNAKQKSARRHTRFLPEHDNPCLIPKAERRSPLQNLPELGLIGKSARFDRHEPAVAPHTLEIFYVAKESVLHRITIDGRKVAGERDNLDHLTPPRSADKRGSLNAAARGPDVRPRLFFG
jgi:hypothetical protein